MDDFQKIALRTWSYSESELDNLLHATLGLVGEGGEFSELVKKAAYKKGRALDVGRAREELADVLYYAAVLLHLLGTTFEESFELLRVKLADGHGWVDVSEPAA